MVKKGNTIRFGNKIFVIENFDSDNFLLKDKETNIINWVSKKEVKENLEPINFSSSILLESNCRKSSFNNNYITINLYENNNSSTFEIIDGKNIYTKTYEYNKNRAIYEFNKFFKYTNELTPFRLKKYGFLLKESEKEPKFNDAFWKWFGNSVYKNSRGNPLIAYHNSPNKFNEFDINKVGSRDFGFYGYGIYFSTHKSIASQYGKNHYDVYLKMENPFMFDREYYKYPITEESYSIVKKYEEYNLLTEDELNIVHELENIFNNTKIQEEKTTVIENGRTYPTTVYHLQYKDKTYSTDPHMLLDEKDAMSQFIYNDFGDLLKSVKQIYNVCMRQRNKQFAQMLQKNGYDSIWAGTEIVVFNPNQIKSVKNVGTWNPNSNNIYESMNVIETKESPIYITNNMYDIFKLQKKMTSLRVLIDEQKKIYMIGNALYHIHGELFDEAIEAGYYNFNNEREKDIYWENLPAIIIDTDDFLKHERKDDYFDGILRCNGFVVYYRTNNYTESDFTKTKLYNLLISKYNDKQEINENKLVESSYEIKNIKFYENPSIRWIKTQLKNGKELRVAIDGDLDEPYFRTWLVWDAFSANHNKAFQILGMYEEDSVNLRLSKDAITYWGYSDNQISKLSQCEDIQKIYPNGYKLIKEW